MVSKDDLATLDLSLATGDEGKDLQDEEGRLGVEIDVEHGEDATSTKAKLQVPSQSGASLNLDFPCREDADEDAGAASALGEIDRQCRLVDQTAGAIQQMLGGDLAAAPRLLQRADDVLSALRRLSERASSAAPTLALRDVGGRRSGGRVVREAQVKACGRSCKRPAIDRGAPGSGLSLKNYSHEFWFTARHSSH